MQLNYVDWLVIALYFLFNLAVALYLRKRATQSVSDFFVSGRNVSWWLAGTSMVATTFAADTPLVVTGLVARNGIAGNWIWWSMVFSGMLTVFFYAKLWRRAGVLTDVEFAEIRYHGKPAAFLRIFRAIYLGLPINLIIMGWVNLAIVKIMMSVLGISKIEALFFAILIMFITASISSLSGLWGVLWTDMFQFFLKMSMVILLAVYAVSATGGMGTLVTKLHEIDQSRDPSSSILSFVPDLNSTWMPMITFFVFIAVNWWASWYPGAEPGGGGYVAQRIFCAKNEKHSLLATLWFNIAHYALRPWPWVIVALVAVVRYNNDPAFHADPESGYIRILISDLPAYFRGLMLAAFAAAYMSTIGTQLNWGASYLVNDVYRRFIPEKSEKHYVKFSQVVTMVLMILSAIVTFYMDSIASAWQFLMAIGAGTGLVYILRWFWWRINAWSEISAMASAFVVSLVLQFGFGLTESNPKDFAYLLLITTGVTTAVWLTVTFLTKPEPNEVLLSFYRRVRPNATMWAPIAKQATDIVPQKDGLFNLMNWVSGVIMIYCTLFGVGRIVLGDTLLGIVLLAIGIFFGGLIYYNMNRKGWETLSA
ncbi:MAG: Na+:solute symporter [Ignavibacteria bacterium]|jgi:Na+/proline symporter|nr:Na+:solute symporter [Ignavibacteria bacterium]MCU7522026.1 Na+:solute symporter [Ignavibacteria bacterium]